MRKVLIIIAFTVCIETLPLYGTSSPASVLSHYYQQSEPERLMKLFLKAVQSDNDKEVKDFIIENYSKRFLEIPVTVHEKVINNLQKDFAHLIVTQTIKNDNKITATIKSPINKTKQITIETDKGNPAKILIVDVKD
jgi:hypothetical protein